MNASHESNPQQAKDAAVAHTPGPWVLFPFTEKFNNTSGERDGWHVNQVNGPACVATLYARPHRISEDTANARLMAAAPVLLDELRRCVFAIEIAQRQERERGDKTAGAWDHILKPVRAAIARAEGR